MHPKKQFLLREAALPASPFGPDPSSSPPALPVLIVLCVLAVVSFFRSCSVNLREEECEGCRLEEDQEETPVTESDSDGPEAADPVSVQAAARYSGFPGQVT